MSAYCDNYRKHTNEFCGQSSKNFKVKAWSDGFPTAL